MSDTELVELVLGGKALGAGIGGSRSLVRLEDVPLFVKQVPLTDLERKPDNVGSTANLFGLPMGCNYGVGSPSFGVWREVAANVMTTGWAVSGHFHSVPMMHHWRAVSVPAFAGALPDELGDVDALVEHWHGSDAVRHRVEAIAESSAAVLLFFEYIPLLLSNHLAALAAAEELSDATLESRHKQLVGATTIMNSRGLLHLDTHFGNVLADASDIYLTDLGLANSASFDLDASELEFVEYNRTHDVAYATTRLLNWVVTNVGGISEPERRNGAIKQVASGEPPESILPDFGAPIVGRFAAVASTMNSFYEALHLDDRNTAYPSEAVETAWATATSR